MVAEEQADSLHTSIEAQPDGSVVVTEQITWRFPDGEDRHGIYRLVRVRAGYQDSTTRYRYYALSGVEVTSPSGAPTDITIEDDGADRRIRIGSPSLTVAGDGPLRRALPPGPPRQRHRRRHRRGLLRRRQHREQLPPARRAATVSGPAPVTRAACFSGPYGSTDPCPATAGPTATYEIPDLAAAEGASVVASFPRDAFGDLTPELRSGDVRSTGGSSVSPGTARLLGGLALGTGVLVPLAAAALMGLLVWTRGRDEQYAGLTPGLSPGRGRSRR